MISRISDLSPGSLAVFDDVIDVRSPAEFAEDSLPGAISMPALDDAERARVGTIYKQVSTFEARRIGAALVARNVACGLETTLADRPRDWRPLLYCWRGGQRSGAVATIFTAVGWRTSVVEGGWRTWRRLVVDATRGEGADIPILLVDGQTGCAKTEILNRAGALGGATIDLEGAGAHRGSAFGALGDRPQPSQKRFESLIFAALQAGAPGVSYLVEAESAFVGRLRVPARVWRSMRSAPRIEIRAPIGARAAFTTTMYADICADPARLDASMMLLSKFHSRETIAKWRALAASRLYEELARTLMVEHYDAFYERARAKREDRPAAVLDLPDLSPASLNAAAAEITRLARRIPA